MDVARRHRISARRQLEFYPWCFTADTADKILIEFRRWETMEGSRDLPNGKEFFIIGVEMNNKPQTHEPQKQYEASNQALWALGQKSPKTTYVFSIRKLLSLARCQCALPDIVCPGPFGTDRRRAETIVDEINLLEKTRFLSTSKGSCSLWLLRSK